MPHQAPGQPTVTPPLFIIPPSLSYASEQGLISQEGYLKRVKLILQSLLLRSL